MAITCAIIILSDKASEGIRKDECAPIIRELLLGTANVTCERVMGDDKEALMELLIKLADANEIDLILTSGGTGLSPRDITPEATLNVIEKEVPGIAEYMRAYSTQITSRAMLSRAVAGMRGRTLIINLPGSPKAVRECLTAILPVLPHAVETIKGEAHECAKSAIE